MTKLKCKAKGCDKTGLPVAIHDAETGKEIRFRCGTIAFCGECLKRCSAKHPEYEYRVIAQKMGRHK